MSLTRVVLTIGCGWVAYLMIPRVIDSLDRHTGGGGFVGERPLLILLEVAVITVTVLSLIFANRNAR